jgi:hypothetical protein
LGSDRGLHPHWFFESSGYPHSSSLASLQDSTPLHSTASCAPNAGSPGRRQRTADCHSFSIPDSALSQTPWSASVPFNAGRHRQCPLFHTGVNMAITSVERESLIRVCLMGSIGLRARGGGRATDCPVCAKQQHNSPKTLARKKALAINPASGHWLKYPTLVARRCVTLSRYLLKAAVDQGPVV